MASFFQDITRKLTMIRDRTLADYMRLVKRGLGLAFAYQEGDAISLSIDVTNVCNLECAGCYYYAKPYEHDQLSVTQWIERIREIKRQHPGVIHCTWVGGEPLLRKDLVETGINEFDFNWIVTNGTVPLPDWRKKVVFWVSIDGPKEYHDRVRSRNRPSSMYERTRTNVLAATTQHICIHTVLNRESWRSTDELLKEWVGMNVIGIRFSLYTPLPNDEDPLWIPWDEQKELVHTLLFLKARYGDFMLQTEDELRLFLPEHSKNIIGEHCLIKKGATLSLDTKGNRKLPCVMGNMDCNRCGCTVPYMAHMIVRRHSLRAIAIGLQTIN